MVGTLPRQSAYLARIWKLRYFWGALVKNDLSNRYKRSFLGIGWSMLKPLAMTAIFCMVFGKLFNVPTSEYAPFVLIGVTFWQFLTETLVAGSHSLAAGSAYIRQQNVPLAIFPLRSVIGSAFHAGVALLVALGIALAFRGFETLNPFALLCLGPAILLLFLLGWCLAIISSVVSTHFPDTRHMLELGLQILFYVTPILYKPESIEGQSRLIWIVEWNPLTSLRALVRVPILEGTPPAWHHIQISLLVLMTCAILAVVLLRRLERNLVFWI